MTNIPIGSCLFISTTAWVMIPKSVNQRVPNGGVCPDEGRLNRADQVAFCSLQDHEAAPEVPEFHAGALFDTPAMFANAIVQFITENIVSSGCSGLSPSGWDGFADVNGDIVRGPVDVMEGFVRTSFGYAIDGVYAGAVELLWDWDVLNGSAVEEAYGVFDDFLEIGRVKHMFLSVKFHLGLYTISSRVSEAGYFISCLT